MTNYDRKVWHWCGIYVIILFIHCVLFRFLNILPAFLSLSRLEEALSDYIWAQKHMRENVVIDYKQLGLRFKLYSWQVWHSASPTHTSTQGHTIIKDSVQCTLKRHKKEIQPRAVSSPPLCSSNISHTPVSCQSLVNGRRHTWWFCYWFQTTVQLCVPLWVLNISSSDTVSIT